MTSDRYDTRIVPDSRGAGNWHDLGPGDLALREWASQGLELPDRSAIRHFRLHRIREQLESFDYDGILLFDPINVRYATDSTNMQVWVMHNAARYCLITADGPVIMFEFGSADHLNFAFELVDEVRPAIPWYYYGAGPRLREGAQKWAQQVSELLGRGSGNRRLAIDRLNPEGVQQLLRHSIHVQNGQELMEHARKIKHADEVKAMRCAIAAAEMGIKAMHENLIPGTTEQELWSYLHAEMIKRGGEWIETRLLSSGPRTNPWYQECSSRQIEEGDIVAFDTDLIGTYGMCVDISRTWRCGDSALSSSQSEIFDLAIEQIGHNTSLLGPGVSLEDLSKSAFVPDGETYRRYSTLYHGVGLCDEYPGVPFADQWEVRGYDDVLEPGMILCVESYVGRFDGREGVKLEEQVLITEDGRSVLSSYPLTPVGAPHG